MKALSFRQPWAELILQGRKTLDLRTFSTGYRGPLAVYASKTVEREACLRHDLDPDRLATGGVIGVVELVDVIPLSEADYTERQAEHLAGRSFREGMHGWVLRNPQRLPVLVPAHGRLNLFNVDLETDQPLPPPAAKTQMEGQSPKKGRVQVSSGTKRYPSRSAELEPEPTDRPFELMVKTIPPANNGATTNYALTLRQRIIQPPEVQPTLYGHSPAYMTDIVTLSSDTLRAVSAHVLEALREGGYKATDLSPARRTPFHLPEAVGVRLGLTFLAVKPLSKVDRIEAISQGIRQMTLEEAYYWYSKCTAADTAERAQKALRVLLAAE